MKVPEIRLTSSGKTQLYCVHCDVFYSNVLEWRRCHPEGDRTTPYESSMLLDFPDFLDKRSSEAKDE